MTRIHACIVLGVLVMASAAAVALFALGGVCYGAEPSPNIHGETLEQTAWRTGYTVEEIETYFPPIEKWVVDPAVGKLAASFAADRFKAPPKPGIHPRVYFGPDEIPAIRKRFKDTHVGKLQYHAIRGRLLQVSPKREDWESVPYKPKPADIERYRENGYGIQPRMGFRGPWVGGWINYNPVEYAYRTCGLVRGGRPYAIIVDDVKKDDKPHVYTWLMQIPDDLTIAANSVTKVGGGEVRDIIPADKTDRRLLVRVFKAGGDSGAKLDPVTRTFRNRKYAYHRLVMSSRAKVGHFKVMLCAFRKGESLPETTSSDNGSTVTVKFGKQKDTLRFTATKDGRTRMAIDRNGKKICEVK